MPANNGASNAAISADGNRVAFRSTATNLAGGHTGLNVYVKDFTTGQTQLVSRRTGAAGTADGSAFGGAPAINADGTRVAWETSSSMDAADTNSVHDVYLRDLVGATTVLVSRKTTAGGVVGTADSGDPTISSNGLSVAFATSSPLDAIDTNGESDVYVRTGNATGLVSLNQAGNAAANGASYGPSMNGDGLFIGFTSTATNLVTDPDGNGNSDVFVRDLGLSSTTLVSRPDGATTTEFPGESYGAALSQDGTRIGFTNSSGGTTHAYVRVLAGNATTLVSRASGVSGALADRGGSSPSLSSAGTVVVFGSDSGNLGGPDADNSQVYVRDLVASTTAIVPAGQVGGGGAARAYQGLSDDGRLALFVSDADGLATNDNDSVTNAYLRNLQTGELRTLLPGANGDTDVAALSGDGRTAVLEVYATNVGAGVPGLYAYDVATGAVELVSRQDGVNGVPLSPDEYAFAVSGNGRRIAFDTSVAIDAVNDTNGTNDVYVRDLDAKTTRLVSRATGAAGAGGNASSSSPSLDATGNRIAFTTAATNLGDGDTNASRDVHVRDLAAGTTTLVSRPDASATPGDDDSAEPAISGDGTKVAFSSNADNLNGASADSQIFVRDLTSGATRVVSRVGAAGAIGDARSYDPDLSSDGGTVAFVTEAPNLTLTPTVDAAAVVRTLATGTNVLASRANGPAGSLADDVSGPTLNGNGSCLLFTGRGAGLSAYASPDFNHVLLRVLSGECPPQVASPADRTAPAVAKAKLKPKSFVAGKGRKAGTKVTFQLSEPAKVTLAVGKRSLTVTGKAGANKVRFTGRFGKKTLKPGRYKLVITAVDAAGNRSTPVKVKFRVVSKGSAR